MEGGVFTSFSMDSDSNIPLCFYVHENDFKVGSFAKERFLLNDRNAYNGYFELIKDPSKTFVLHGDSKPIKQLLYYGIENYLSFFIKTILYKNESIESFRTYFCLRLWFNDDIEIQEKTLVDNLFKEAGYENVTELNIDLHLNREISHEIKSGRSRICLSSISNHLYIKLFKSPNFLNIAQINLENLGADPRAKILAKLILEDIKEANPHLYIDEEKETSYIIGHCTSLLSELTPIISNNLELSTGLKVDYKIRKSHLEERLLYNRGIEDKVIPKLLDIIGSNGLNVSEIDIVLIRDELNTNYFKEKLTKKFPNVYGIGTILETKVLKSLFSEVSTNKYQLNQNAPVDLIIQDDSISTVDEHNIVYEKLSELPRGTRVIPIPPVPPIINQNITRLENPSSDIIKSELNNENKEIVKKEPTKSNLIIPGQREVPIKKTPPITVIPPPIINIQDNQLYDVYLNSAGKSKIALVNLIKEVTGLTLSQSKKIVDNNGSKIKESLLKKDALIISEKLSTVGAIVDIIPQTKNQVNRIPPPPPPPPIPKNKK